MTAAEISKRLNISRTRLNQLLRYLDPEKDYTKANSKMFLYKESAFKKLSKRQSKYSKFNPKGVKK